MSDKVSKAALRLADAVIALLVGDEYSEMMDSYDGRYATKRETRSLESARAKFKKLRNKAYALATEVKGGNQ